MNNTNPTELSRLLLGVLTPSSNTALEPLTSNLLRQIPNTSAHFSRFTVTRISLDSKEVEQFDLEPILNAAKLLSDAKVKMIGWSGTAAGWLGFEHDEKLCDAIEKVTGIKATSSILALNEVLKRLGTKRIAIISPYTSDIQEKIVINYNALGIKTIAERHLNISDNFAFSEITHNTLRRCIHEVAKYQPDAILLYCTNLRSADQVQQWESEIGIPIIDSASTVIWKMLDDTGVDCNQIKGWGQFFQEASK